MHITTQQRREREKQYRRQQIIEAASQLLYQKTYSDVTMDDIASAAALAKGSVYYYFKNKSQILYEIIKDGLERLLATLEHASSLQGKPIERLHSVIVAHAMFLRDNRDLMQLIWRTANMPSDIFAGQQHQELGQYHHKSNELLMEVIRQVIDNTGKQVSPKYVSAIIGGVMMGSVSMCRHVTSEDEWRRYTETIFAVITDGIT